MLDRIAHASTTPVLSACGSSHISRRYVSGPMCAQPMALTHALRASRTMQSLGSSSIRPVQSSMSRLTLRCTRIDRPQYGVISTSKDGPRLRPSRSTLCLIS